LPFGGLNIFYANKAGMYFVFLLQLDYNYYTAVNYFHSIKLISGFGRLKNIDVT